MNVPRLALRLLCVALLLTLALGATASAQPSPYVPSPYALPPYAPTYAATPPTAGALYQDAQTRRYLLGGTWLFRPDYGNYGWGEGWYEDNPSTAGWTEVSIPNTFNLGDFSAASWAGWIGWYRRDFTLPANAFASYVPAADRHWIIRFESVNYACNVWLNGRLIGRHVGENLPFEFVLTGIRPGVNQLIVQVDNRIGPGQVPPGPGGGWWNFGGILREVYLRAVQTADISQVQIHTSLTCPPGQPQGAPACVATVSDQVLVRNLTAAPQTVQLQGVYGNAQIGFGRTVLEPYGSWSTLASAQIHDPDLWSIDHPALYKATLTLSDARGRPLGGYLTYSGIRTIAVTADGRLELNGRPLNLRGVEIREQNLQTGAALTPAQLAQLVAWVKQLGATVIRADPLNPQIEELADRDGLLIWADIPVDQQVTTPELSQPSVLQSAQTMLTDDILDNGNHPSIMLWSIANELPTPATPPEASYILSQVTLAHQLDPTRPVGMAITDWPGVACQPAYAPLQVIGFNDYFGWFDAGGGTTDDRDALGPFLDSLRACYPNKALVISEFGFDANQSGPLEQRGTYAFQSNSAAFHLGVFASKPYLSGAIYFLLQDAATYPSYNGGNPFPDPPWDQKGLIDQYGNLKPAFDTVASIYHATQQIAPVAASAGAQTAAAGIKRTRAGTARTHRS